SPRLGRVGKRPRARDDLAMPAQEGGRREDQADARGVGRPGGQARQDGLLPARGAWLLRLALIEAQLLAQREDLQRLVMAAAREDVDQVEEEREHDVEDQE